MKKLYFSVYGVAGLAVLSVFFPWLHATNSDYYVFGSSLTTGVIGLFGIILSAILLAFKKIKVTITIMVLILLNSYGFIFGWANGVTNHGFKNVFEGLQFGLFLYLFSILVYFILILRIKNRIVEINKNKELKNEYGNKVQP